MGRGSDNEEAVQERRNLLLGGRRINDKVKVKEDAEITEEKVVEIHSDCDSMIAQYANDPSRVDFKTVFPTVQNPLDMQRTALGVVFRGGITSTLYATGWKESDIEAVEKLATSAKYFKPSKIGPILLRAGLALGFSLAINNKNKGRELSIEEILLQQKSDSLNGPLLLEQNDIDLNILQRNVATKIKQAKLPSLEGRVLPPPGFTHQNVDHLIQLMVEDPDLSKLLDYQATHPTKEMSDAFNTGLWVGLWANEVERRF